MCKEKRHKGPSGLCVEHCSFTATGTIERQVAAAVAGHVNGVPAEQRKKMRGVRPKYQFLTAEEALAHRYCTSLVLHDCGTTVLPLMSSVNRYTSYYYCVVIIACVHQEHLEHPAALFKVLQVCGASRFWRFRPVSAVMVQA
jgi:hypothetical protein